MRTVIEHTLLAAVSDSGWGSLGKLRLILDRLGPARVTLYGSPATNGLAARFLGARHRFVEEPAQRADVALVIGEAQAANRIADFGIPVIYVDGLPYARMMEAEIPDEHKIAYYCAQKFPEHRLPLAGLLKDRRIRWVEPIVPAQTYRCGGQGIVIHLGGLQDDSAEANWRRMAPALVKELKVPGWMVRAVCGNLNDSACRLIQDDLPDCPIVGPQTPYEFEALLQGADMLITTPGSTMILHAAALKLPTLLLPPRNPREALNTYLFASATARAMQSPSTVALMDGIEQRVQESEDQLRAHIKLDVANAFAAAAEIPWRLSLASKEGMLDLSLAALGRNGAAQVAQLIKQAMLAPLRRSAAGES